MEHTSGAEEGARSSGSSGGQTPPIQGYHGHAAPVPSAVPQQPSPSQSPLSATSSGKIVGRNVNGTMVLTSTPSNEAELHLYRVMQRASLLAYYDTLLEMGGDDVQQLCDAGEEEFLEIMALVGMASKPLHVRRLQKALQEWVTNPSMFQAPIHPSVCPAESPSFLNCGQRLIGMTTPSIAHTRSTVVSPDTNRPMFNASPSPGVPESSPSQSSSVSPNLLPSASPNRSAPSHFPTSASSKSPYPVHYSTIQPTTPLMLTPTLTDAQISRLAAAAERLSRRQPQREPRPQNAKKKMCRDLEQVMQMPETDPRRMDEIRRYAAIYGRFDCKRRPEKPLTLHEVSVNEAAAQVCRYIPALLTRRDELFPLARQVVRDAGYPPHQRVHPGTGRADSDSDLVAPTKRPRLYQGGNQGEGDTCRQDICDDTPLMSRASVLPLLHRSRLYDPSTGEGNKISNYYVTMRQDSDDADSRYSFSNSSSPPPQNENGLEHQDVSATSPVIKEETRSLSEGADSYTDGKVQVIAASGGHIIAVANPALGLSHSPAMLADSVKRESRSSEEDVG